MKASEINMHCEEGKLLVAACMVLKQFGPVEFKSKEGDEILDALKTVVDALES